MSDDDNGWNDHFFWERVERDIDEGMRTTCRVCFECNIKQKKQGAWRLYCSPKCAKEAIKLRKKGVDLEERLREYLSELARENNDWGI